jgi:hypothetical protein
MLSAELAHSSPSLNLSFYNGIRVDDLHWNVAGDIDGNNPNIISELTWSDLRIYQIKGCAEIISANFILLISFEYGCIITGKNQDSNYLGDDRTLEFSRSNNNAGSGYVLDGLFSAGYQFQLVYGLLRIVPLIGPSYHRQALRMTDGVQTIPPLGAYSEDLDSTYDTNWPGV